MKRILIILPILGALIVSCYNINNPFFSSPFTGNMYMRLTAPETTSDIVHAASGNVVPVTWESNAGGNVKIELFKGGSLVSTLSSSTENDGSFNWTPATSLTAGSDYLVKVTSLSHNDVSDDSEETFRVRNWVNLGYVSDVASLDVIDFHVATDPSDNKPIVVFEDADNSYYPCVKKWSNDTSWTSLGNPLSADCNFIIIETDPSDNHPVVALSNGSNDGQVLKWQSGTTWSSLGVPYSGIGDSWTSGLAFDMVDNKPLLAETINQSTHVYKWSSGTTWTDLGSVDAHQISTDGQKKLLQHPADNVPVVIGWDFMHNGQVGVYKWQSGTTWENMGYPLIDSPASYSTLAYRESDDTLFALGRTHPNFSLYLRSYDSGTSWNTPLMLEYSCGYSYHFEMDKENGNPVVCYYKNYGSNWEIICLVIEDDTTIVDIGSPSGLLAGSNNSKCAFAIDDLNRYYALYLEGTDPNFGRLICKRYD